MVETGMKALSEKNQGDIWSLKLKEGISAQGKEPGKSGGKKTKTKPKQKTQEATMDLALLRGQKGKDRHRQKKGE